METHKRYRICIECIEPRVLNTEPSWKKVCIGCYIKKKTSPFNKCMINIKKT